MSNLFLTLVIAFVIIVLAIASLAIGWLITGKTKIERGACGRNPNQKKDDSCQSTCDLCSTDSDARPFSSEESMKEEEELAGEGDSDFSPSEETPPPSNFSYSQESEEK